MNWRKLSLALALMTLGAFAAAQEPMPPPDFEGASYWFGPGPRQTVSLDSSHQDNGAYMDFSSMSSGGSSSPITLDAATGRKTGHITLMKRVTVQPYCYVDGYFGSSSSVSGFSMSSWVSLGECRFYVVHNCPVLVSLSDFTQMVSDVDSDGDGTLDACPTQWTFTCAAYRPGRPVFASFTVDGAPPGSVSQPRDITCLPGFTGGTCEITCATTFSSPPGMSSVTPGLYTGSVMCVISI